MKELPEVIEINAASRDRLEKYVRAISRDVERRKAAVREEGQRARADARSHESCPYEIASWMGVRWLEGWSSTLAPERTSFNITPSDDVAAFSLWVSGLDIPQELKSRLIAASVASYRPDAFSRC